MTRLTTLDLTPFHRSFVGFDRLFEDMDRMFENSPNTNGGYPPYNIVKDSDKEEYTLLCRYLLQCCMEDNRHLCLVNFQTFYPCLQTVCRILRMNDEMGLSRELLVLSLFSPFNKQD